MRDIDEFLIDLKKKGYKCIRCGHEWIPRKKNGKPQTCPKCRTTYWDKERKVILS